MNTSRAQRRFLRRIDRLLRKNGSGLRLHEIPLATSAGEVSVWGALLGSPIPLVVSAIFTYVTVMVSAVSSASRLSLPIYQVLGLSAVGAAMFFYLMLFYVSWRLGPIEARATIEAHRYEEVILVACMSKRERRRWDASAHERRLWRG
ncbi:hypothetical protein [Microbacterium sp. MMO-10]|uniref:hypothetical protein n=1 Tax=Microbacterium sp. MMO-10 TaxID=3081272 RepID=UPI0030166DC1